MAGGDRYILNEGEAVALEEYHGCVLRRIMERERERAKTVKIASVHGYYDYRHDGMPSFLWDHRICHRVAR